MTAFHPDDVQIQKFCDAEDPEETESALLIKLKELIEKHISGKVSDSSLSTITSSTVTIVNAYVSYRLPRLMGGALSAKL